MEEKEFRQQVMPLQRMMYALALKIGLPPDDAADAVQETMLRLWRGRHGIPEDEPGQKAYCTTAIRNECLKVLKKRRDDRTIEGAIGIDTGTTELPEAMEAKDTRILIERLMAFLPEGQRRVVRLSGFGEYDIAEISSATGFSQSNVRQLLSRGRRRLREFLNNYERK